MKRSTKYECETSAASEELPLEELAMILAQIYINSTLRKEHERGEEIFDPLQ